MDVQGGKVDPLVAWCKSQLEILEALFPNPEWFQSVRNKNHPAYKHWHTCHRLLNRQKSTVEELFETIRTANHLNNLFVLTNNYNAKWPTDIFGELNKEVVDKISSRLNESNSYSDIMFEVEVAAAHIGNGIKSVEPQERENWPDIIVKLEVPNIPLGIECKNLHTHRSTHKVEDRMGEASKQIDEARKGLGYFTVGGQEDGKVEGYVGYGVAAIAIDSLLEDPNTRNSNFKEIVRLIEKKFHQEFHQAIQYAILVVHIATLTISSNYTNLVHLELHRTCEFIRNPKAYRTFPNSMPEHLYKVFHDMIAASLLRDSFLGLRLPRELIKF